MINKERLEKMLKKDGKVAVYLPDNTQCKVVAQPVIRLVKEGHKPIEFPIDCHDLWEYCLLTGLSFTQNNKN